MDRRGLSWRPVRRGVHASMLMAVALATAISMGTPRAAQAAPVGAADDGSGSLGVRLLDVPAATVDDPRATSYIVDALQPGATISRRVEVSNTSAGSMDVSVYAAAADITDGAFVVRDGRTANELSSWTTADRAEIEVPAGAEVDVTMTVAVPLGAAPGEQYAVIWAETAGTTDGNIREISRVGVRMYLAVLGDNALTSAFTISSMTAERAVDGRGIVRVEVTNTGGRALDLSGELTMSAVVGAVRVGPYDAEAGTTLAPGQSGTVTFAITDTIADGPWNAVVDLHSGLTTGSHQARVTFPVATGVVVIAAPRSAWADLLGWGLASLGLLLISAVVLVVVRRRRSSR